MRAAAIEARLSGVPPPTQLTSVKGEPAASSSSSSPVPMPEAIDNDCGRIKLEPDDVDDPHLSAEARKKELEADLGEDERRQLKGGWEEFFSSAGLKRPAEGGVASGKRARDTASGTFGAGLLKQETLKGFGLSATTLGGTSRTIGSAPVGSHPMLSGEKTEIGGQSGWSCKLCTFENIADQGRCGE